MKAKLTMRNEHQHSSLRWAILITIGLASPLFGESIWQRRSPENSLLFYDTRARYPGDLVTVVVSQQTDVDSIENRGLNKSTQAGNTLDIDFESGGAFGVKAANAAFDFGATSGREFDGSSNYRSAQGFTDRVTATVTQVMPNGNLVISGQRDVQVGGEMRTLILSGVIRPIDLSPQNMVHSRYIADFRLTYEGAGPSQAFTRQGWLGRAANRIWPF